MVFRCGVKKGIQDQDSRLLNNSNLYPCRVLQTEWGVGGGQGISAG